VVPAEVIARSQPSGHSVPIVRGTQKSKRAHPYRNLVMASLVSLFGMGIAVYYSIEAGRGAGSRLPRGQCRQGIRRHLSLGERANS